MLRAFQRDLRTWYGANKRALPWRKKTSPYRTAVSELMCQQTQIATVLPYFERWMKRWPDWPALAAAGEEEILKAWEGLGYYRRARMLHALAHEVVASGDGELPADFDALLKLPGIGRYTAGAIGSIAFGLRAPVVDGNVERVLARVFDLDWNVSTPAAKKALEQLATRLLPQKGCECGGHNQALMELGALICTPRKPLCLHCPLRKACAAKTPESLPLKKRAESVEEQETLALIERAGKLLLTCPPDARRWKGSYRLPFFEQSLMAPTASAPVAALRYSVTRYRIHAQLLRAKLLSRKTPPHSKWFTPRELEAIFLPAPHRKLIHLALPTILPPKGYRP